jgi:hypothetical protein
MMWHYWPITVTVLQVGHKAEHHGFPLINGIKIIIFQFCFKEPMIFNALLLDHQMPIAFPDYVTA